MSTVNYFSHPTQTCECIIATSRKIENASRCTTELVNRPTIHRKTLQAITLEIAHVTRQLGHTIPKYIRVKLETHTWQ